MAEKEKEEKTIQTCFNCGCDENSGYLFTVRTKGEEKWVCSRCLPMLIHG